MDIVVLAKLVPIARLPERGPADPGANVRLTTQVPPDGSGDKDVQLSVSRKSPDVMRFVIWSEPAVELVNVTCCSTLLLNVLWLPNNTA